MVTLLSRSWLGKKNAQKVLHSLRPPRPQELDGPSSLGKDTSLPCSSPLSTPSHAL